MRLYTAHAGQISPLNSPIVRLLPEGAEVIEVLVSAFNRAQATTVARLHGVPRDLAHKLRPVTSASAPAQVLRGVPELNDGRVFVTYRFQRGPGRTTIAEIVTGQPTGDHAADLASPPGPERAIELGRIVAEAGDGDTRTFRLEPAVPAHLFTADLSNVPLPPEALTALGEPPAAGVRRPGVLLVSLPAADAPTAQAGSANAAHVLSQAGLGWAHSLVVGPAVVDGIVGALLETSVIEPGQPSIHLITAADTDGDSAEHTVLSFHADGGAGRFALAGRLRWRGHARWEPEAPPTPIPPVEEPLLLWTVKDQARTAYEQLARTAETAAHYARRLAPGAPAGPPTSSQVASLAADMVLAAEAVRALEVLSNLVPNTVVANPGALIDRARLAYPPPPPPPAG